MEKLVALGAQVRAFVRYNSRGDPGLLTLLSPETLAQVEILPGDLRDQAAVQEAAQGMTHIFHLGALIAIPYSYLHPFEVVETNVIGTLNVLLATKQAKVERLVHTSSSEVYGTAQWVPINETHPLQGQSPYAASKIAADKLVESFYLSFGLPVVTLRPFNTYGPRQSTRAVVPTIITQALTQEVIHLGNLEAIRDLTYVSDTVSGFLKVCQATALEGETINLGSGNEVSIDNLTHCILNLIGRHAEIVVDSSRLRPAKSEVQRLLCDNRLAKERLDWSPSISLEKGLLQTIDWIRDHLDHYRPGEYQV